jgi:outer membrane protein OmpA-like peptidoglycan-associated protein
MWALLLLSLSSAPAWAQKAPVNKLQPDTALPLVEATLTLVDATLNDAELPPLPEGQRRSLVIDPIIDRATGQETVATRMIGRRMAEIIAERHPQFVVKPFTEAVLAENPLRLLGSMTPSKLGDTQPAAEPADTYRIWAVLVDLASGMVLSHPTAWVKASDVDATPTEFYKQSPVWLGDALHAAYIRTCASAPDKPADAEYLRGVHTQSLVTQAIEAYEARDYRRSLTLYEQARTQPGGVQLRVLNGIYLAKRALRDRRGEEAAFKELVDYGLEKNRLALKLLFRPGSATLPMEASAGPQYRMWLDVLAERAGSRQVCLLVSGHASLTGSTAFNDKLSHRRAEFAAHRLQKHERGLQGRLQTQGFGFRQPLVGTGTDDLRDALDRRVEFSVRDCRAEIQTSSKRS